MPTIDPAAIELIEQTDRLVEVLRRAGRIGGGEAWERHFARIRAAREPWATAVIMSDRGQVVGVHARSEAGPGSIAIDTDPPVWLDVWEFPNDPDLPSLSVAVAGLDDHDVIRYRPGNRCTMLASRDGLRRFVKVSADATAIDQITRIVHATVQRHEIHVAVPEPLGLTAAGQAVHLRIVSGRPLFDRIVSAEGPDWSYRIGEILGRLAAVEPEDGGAVTQGGASSFAIARRDHHEQRARTERAIGRASAQVPSLGPRLRFVLDQLDARQADLRPKAVSLVHGSPHLHQWLIDGDAIGLVDFDRFGWGDLELDIATYLAELDFERSSVAPIRDHEQAIANGAAIGGTELDPRRLWLYRLHKRVAKVARTAAAPRTDAAVRASDQLVDIERSLGAGPPA
ncbi:MAG: phosphotransferase [Acidimicrobiales bacterium]